MTTIYPTDTPFGIAVVCTMTASDVYSCNWEMNTNRSKEWCQDFIVENCEAIHNAMVSAAFDAIETLS
jgi:hypothetical protein